MKTIFVIDWTLIPLFILSAWTGIELHMAGHGGDHAFWHAWALFHVAASLLFLIAGICHLTTHWGWYRGVLKMGIGSKSKVTIWLSAVFVFVATTGVVLLFVDGANSKIGLWHYKTGLLICVLAVGHLLKRSHALRKSLK